MYKFIQSIRSKIPHTDVQVEIELDGRNLIITGGNGSGKTTFLKSVFSRVEVMALNSKYFEVETWRERLAQFQNQLSLQEVGSAHYRETQSRIEVCRSNIDPYVGDPEIGVNNHTEFDKAFGTGYATVSFFPADRKSAIAEARSASGLNYRSTELRIKNTAVGNQLEQHLVNLATRRAFGESKDTNDFHIVKIIDGWFNRFESNLQFLFEDDSVRLQFDPGEFRYYLVQDGRSPFTFQDLSSGYSAILSILSALLMRAEYLHDDPETLGGVVFIDEIDAHLHVSLQRKIFPFLARSFPRVQFIVTTHSPFVLTSVSDAIIFDMNRREQVEDLSAYSYEAVLEGLFGVGQSSILLQKRIRELAALTNIANVDVEAVAPLVAELLPEINHLDEESKYFLNRAKGILNSKGVDNV